MQDSDFVAHKDDEGSPTDDSGANNSKGSDNGDEKEACDFCLPLLSLWQFSTLKIYGVSNTLMVTIF